MATSGGGQHAALARPLEDEVMRQRLIDQLADRWIRRLITVVAPGGAGKSTAVAQAIRDNALDPSGVDLYARCSAAVHTAQDVAGLLATTVGAAAPSAGDVLAAVPQITAALAEYSPNDVCLHIDDVHHLEHIDGAASLLDALIDALPHQAHMVLAGRRLPAIKLSKLRAADLLAELRADHLRFTDGEARELATKHQREAADVESTGGWPALTRLALAIGPEASHEYLIEEVIGSLSAGQRRAVAAISLAGAATDELLALIDTTATVNELLTDVPLLIRREDGAVTTHDLWGESIDAIVDRGERQRLLEIIVGHQATHSPARAAETALVAEDWALARSHIVKALGAGDLDLTQATLDRWVDLFARAEVDTPETRLLEAMQLRLAGRHADAAELLDQAVHLCRNAGLIEAETTAVWEIGVVAWLSGDGSLGKRQREYAASIIERGGTRMAQLMDRTMVGVHENAGRFLEAIEVYDRMRTDDEIGLRHCASLAILAGDDALAARYIDRLLTVNDGEHASRLVVQAHDRLVQWFRGDVTPMIETFTRRRDVANGAVGPQSPTGVRRNDFLVHFHDLMVSAALGHPVAIDHIEDLAWTRDREQTFVAFAHAAQALLAGNEEQAAAEFCDRIEAIGPFRPRVYAELRRFLAYGYVLHPATRAAIDADESLGPWHRQQRALARAFVALRARPGEPVAVEATDGQVLAWLPLPWSMELAVSLARQGHPRGTELAGYLADRCGARAHDVLKQLGSRDESWAAAVATVAGNVPAPMSHPTHVSVIGEPSVTISGQTSTVGRGRVKQVLTLLALRPSIERSELIALLWPDHEEAKGRANLRTTLRHLRSTLEPDRPAGWASFTLRQRDEHIWLQRSEALTCDVWQVTELLEAAGEARKHGDDDDAERSFLAAFELWRGDGCAGARALPTDLPMLATLDRATTGGACWVAEHRLAHSQPIEARKLAQRIIERSPYEIRALDLMIASSLDRGDLPQAAADIASTAKIEQELGVDRSMSTSMLVRRYERRVERTAS